MKKVYFVRHGESEANAGDFHSSPPVPLTHKGREQAQFIAERCAKLPIEALITSSYVRTKQTAEFISKKIQIPAEESDLFVENRSVSTLWGKSRTEEASKNTMQLITQNWGMPGFRVGDEENFEDIVHRVDAALDFLANKKEEHIGVVTHAGFMRNIVGRALFRDSFTPAVSTTIFRSLHVMENTGLTVLSYDGQNTEHPWMLWVWNDYAHLG